jgi:L-tyrosine isonitrile synthase
MTQAPPAMKNIQLLTASDGTTARNNESGHADARHRSSGGMRARSDHSSAKRPKAGSSGRQVTADDVLNSFNTWAYKREQPSDPEKLHQVVAETLARGEPLSFVLYWGRGPREKLDAPDITCLEYLHSLGQRVNAAYAPGAALTLIFTDTHAKLNGYPVPETHRYFAEIDAHAKQLGFSSCKLSQLTKAALDEGGPIEAVSEVPQDIREILCESAAKWYHGGASIEQGALDYYNCNMIERRAVELAFPRSIFITFNGSKLLGLFPRGLPIFYMYSLRRGFGVKPWFLSVDFQLHEVSARERVA